MATLLSDEEIEKFINQQDVWTRQGDQLQATLQFEDFNEAFGFVTRLALKAERMFHHPDIDIRWNEVSLTLSTHSEGGITDMDLELASFCDSIS